MMTIHWQLGLKIFPKYSPLMRDHKFQYPGFDWFTTYLRCNGQDLCNVLLSPICFVAQQELTRPPKKNIRRVQISMLRICCRITKYERTSIQKTLNCTKKAFRLLCSSIKEISDVLPAHRLKMTFHGHKYSTSNDGQDAQRYIGFVIQLPAYDYHLENVFVVCYDTKTHMTQILLFSKQPHFGEELLSLLEKRLGCYSSPIWTALDVISFATKFLSRRLSDQAYNLGDINQRTGHFKYLDDAAESEIREFYEIDFLSTSRALNMIGQDAAILEAHFTSLLKVLEELRMFKKSTDEFQQSSTSHESTLVDERLHLLLRFCESNLIETNTLIKQCNVLLQVFYQYMAQKDAKVNIELARSSAAIAKASKEDSAIMRTIALESKKDSTAMKTISILGMVFLPGTFIAAVFAMPVFDWDADGAPVMKPASRYYWAITVPLTVTILLTWCLMILLPWNKWIDGLKGKGEGEVESEEKGDGSGI
ncbi:uncharacterized protein LY89DRAFT_691967 [Mollisia scopiformis]|uniref:Uncharacterized protein n=1 Tax=Mollisia scopiformis TaxID=149040 RepID=A0A132B428_MOLSC|nr:uncharacterized protein LY89DRAFT_691967 [Mollisia scopiformis]KUJ07168.1 hypothetical protein LY89DRAFT_691967 [Mollisia scopiformis]